MAKLLDVNTNAVVGFSNTLDQLHKSALPSAIRGALNKAAFDVKTKTMPTTAASTFDQRQPNFFKANSRFKNATGFNIKAMKAVVGFVENKLRGGNNFAVSDLEQQEKGGEIKSKSFIPTTLSRVSKSASKKVRPNARLSSIKNIVDSKKIAGKTRQQRFVRAAKIAGRNGHVLGELEGGKMILWRISQIAKKPGGKLKLIALYSYKEDRTVNVSKTNFMRKSSLLSGKKIEKFYVQEAKRQIKKFKNK